MFLCNILDTNKNLPPELNSDKIMDVNPDKQKIKINNFIFNTATRTLYKSENVSRWFYLVNLVFYVTNSSPVAILNTQENIYNLTLISNCYTLDW